VTANTSERSSFERFLGMFTEVRPGEGITALLLVLNVFLILMSYYVLKPVREALILGEGSAELKSYMSAAQVVLRRSSCRTTAASWRDFHAFDSFFVRMGDVLSALLVFVARPSWRCSRAASRRSMPPSSSYGSRWRGVSAGTTKSWRTGPRRRYGT
jgi:hypothetical protein